MNVHFLLIGLTFIKYFCKFRKTLKVSHGISSYSAFIFQYFTASNIFDNKLHWELDSKTSVTL